jgi:hypothetical protein
MMGNLFDPIICASLFVWRSRAHAALLIHAQAEVCAECQTIAVHYYTVLRLISGVFTLVAVMRFPDNEISGDKRSARLSLYCRHQPSGAISS